MPMPVDRERLPWRERTHARVFWHPGAPAMLDRNGTDVVLNALHLVRTPTTVVISGSGREPGTTQIGRCTVILAAERGDYWEGYDRADVLLLPRRYGGLSLPVQEALSAGLPVVMLDTGPYAGQGGVLTVPTTSARDMAMKGGTFPVYDTDPQYLADQIHELVDDPGLVVRASHAANATAEALSWDVWQRPWRQLLEQP
jgi:glycosyltransferase involved in cell wall biosynthesis